MVRIGSLVGLLLGWMVVQSCTKEDDEDCPFLAPEMVYVGFTEAESDTMVIRRFAKNSGFVKPLDTVLITRAHIIRTEVGKDSFTLEPDNYDGLKTSFYVHDWQIYFPAAGRTISISEITPRFNQEEESSAQCHSYVASLRYDNLMYSFNSWFDTPYRVFAVR